MVRYRRAETGGHRVFYREAGERKNPTVLLLHGFPTSSHMYRDLIPLLADRYHVIAPDLPGFGNTASPPRGRFDYTFDNLARVNFYLGRPGAADVQIDHFGDYKSNV